MARIRHPDTVWHDRFSPLREAEHEQDEDHVRGAYLDGRLVVVLAVSLIAAATVLGALWVINMLA